MPTEYCSIIAEMRNRAPGGSRPEMMSALNCPSRDALSPTAWSNWNDWGSMLAVRIMKIPECGELSII